MDAMPMNAIPLNAQMFKNKFQMPNLLEFLDLAAQIITSKDPGEVGFVSLDLKYAFNQLALDESVSTHCFLSVVCGELTE